MDDIPSPTNVLAAGPSATGLVRPNVSTFTVQINISPTHPDMPGQLLTEHGHKLAANRLCEDEYINYLCSDMHNHNSPNASVCAETEMSELVQGAQVVNVKGCLKACVQFWESISGPPFVLSVIREGYKIPFLHTLMRAFFFQTISLSMNITSLWPLLLRSYGMWVQFWSV